MASVQVCLIHLEVSILHSVLKNIFIFQRSDRDRDLPSAGHSLNDCNSQCWDEDRRQNSILVFHIGSSPTAFPGTDRELGIEMELLGLGWALQYGMLASQVAPLLLCPTLALH